MSHHFKNIHDLQANHFSHCVKNRCVIYKMFALWNMIICDVDWMHSGENPLIKYLLCDVFLKLQSSDLNLQPYIV